jgi:hypothetical protein
VLEGAFDRGARNADPREVADADDRLQELLDQVADPAADGAEQPSVAAVPAPDAAPNLAGVAMRTATPLRVEGRRVVLRLRGLPEPVDGELGPGVSGPLVAQAARNGDAVVLECVAAERPLVVGVLQTTIPAELTLRATKVHIEGEQEVLLRSGRGALRIRQDGDVEIVGSRISAMSRGLFRLVGRVLRLN